MEQITLIIECDDYTLFHVTQVEVSHPKILIYLLLSIHISNVPGVL